MTRDGPGQASPAGVLHAGDEVLEEGVLVGLEMEGQISFQGLQDGGGVRQSQTLPQDA